MLLPTKQDVPPSECYNCKEVLISATPALDPRHKPDPGDVCICMNCGALLIFDEELKQRPPTSAEIGKFRADPKAVKALRKARTQRRLIIAGAKQRKTARWN